MLIPSIKVTPTTILANPSVFGFRLSRVATLLERVRAAAKRYHRLEAEHEQAREDLQAAMRAAHAKGVPLARVAREAGVSRPTAHTWLKR